MSIAHIIGNPPWLTDPPEVSYLGHIDAGWDDMDATLDDALHRIETDGVIVMGIGDESPFRYEVTPWHMTQRWQSGDGVVYKQPTLRDMEEYKERQDAAKAAEIRRLAREFKRQIKANNAIERAKAIAKHNAERRAVNMEEARIWIEQHNAKVARRASYTRELMALEVMRRQVDNLADAYRIERAMAVVRKHRRSF